MSNRCLRMDLIYGTADATTASTLGLPKGMTTEEATLSKNGTSDAFDIDDFG